MNDIMIPVRKFLTDSPEDFELFEVHPVQDLQAELEQIQKKLAHSETSGLEAAQFLMNVASNSWLCDLSIITTMLDVFVIVMNEIGPNEQLRLLLASIELFVRARDIEKAGKVLSWSLQKLQESDMLGWAVFMVLLTQVPRSLGGDCSCRLFDQMGLSHVERMVMDLVRRGGCGLAEAGEFVAVLGENLSPAIRSLWASEEVADFFRELLGDDLTFWIGLRLQMVTAYVLGALVRMFDDMSLARLVWGVENASAEQRMMCFQAFVALFGMWADPRVLLRYHETLSRGLALLSCFSGNSLQAALFDILRVLRKLAENADAFCDNWIFGIVNDVIPLIDMNVNLAFFRRPFLRCISERPMMS